MAGLTCFFLFSIFLVNNVLSRPNPSSNPSPSPSSTTVVQMRSASLDPEYEKDVLKECARVRLEVEEVPEGKREEVLIKKYAMERVDHEKTKEDKNSAVKDKKYESKYRVALTTRNRIEYLENDLWPKNKNKPKNRAERWVIILHSGNPEVSTIRDEVLMKYDPNDPERSIRMFSECLREIYKTESDNPSHGETDSETLLMLRNGSRSDRLKALDVLRVPHDPKFLTALEIISMEVPIPTGSDVFQDSLANYSCVEMTPTKGKFPANLNIAEQDVMEFFPTSTGIKSVEINCDRNMSSHSIKVEFDHINIAVEAFNNNHGWLKREKMQVRLIPC